MVVIRKMNGKSTSFLIGCFNGEYVWTCDHKKATDYSSLSLVTVHAYVAMLKKTYKKESIESILV